MASIETMKTYPNGQLDCLTTTKLGSTVYVDCEFIPSTGYANISGAWFYNYDEFVPKIERLFLDFLFILGFFLFFYGLYKFVKKILF